MVSPILYHDRKTTIMMIVAYLVFYLWSHLFEIVNSGHVVAWLSFGYLAGCLIRLPTRRWWALVGAVFVISSVGPHAFGEAPLWMGSVSGLAQISGAMTGALLYRRLGGSPTGFTSFRDIGLFAAAILMAAPLIGASIEAWIEYRFLVGASLWWHWSVSFGAMSIGAVYVTPLVLFDGQIRGLARASYRGAAAIKEHLVYVALPVVVLVAITLPFNLFTSPFLSFAYAALIGLTLAAVRFGMWGAMTTGLWIGLLSSHATRFGLLDNPFTPLTDHTLILEQSLIAGGILVGYVIAVAVARMELERSRAERAASDFETLVDSSPIGIFVSDLSSIKAWLDQHDLTGYEATRSFLLSHEGALVDHLCEAHVLVNKVVLDLYGIPDKKTFEQHQRTLLKGVEPGRLADLYASLYAFPERPYVFEKQRTRPDGTEMRLHIMHWLMPQNGWDPWQRVVTGIQDETDLHSSLALVSSLRNRNEELAHLLLETEKRARIGSWYWDFKTNEITWSPEMYRINGLDPDSDEELTIETSMRLLHPADRHWVMEKFEQEAMDHVTRFRLLMPDGEVRWIESEGETIRDERGEAVGLRGSQHDVTRMVQTERAKLNAADIIETTAAIAYVARGIERKSIRYVSQGIERFGWQRKSGLTIPDSLFAYADTDDARRVRKHLRALRTATGHISLEYRLRTPSGTVWFRDHVRRVPAEAGEEELFEGVLVDITDEKRTAELLELEEQRRMALEDLSIDITHYDEIEYLQHAETYLESLTGSTISFMHFCDDPSQTVQLQGAWSQRTLAHFCNAVYDSHYPVSEAGIWADAIRRKEAIIVNDYPNEPSAKGLPEGHAPLQRFLALPVMDEDRVVLVAGVGNALDPYGDTDVDSVAIVAREVWHQVKANRLRTQIAESELRMRRFFDQAYDALAYYEARDGGRQFVIRDLNKVAEIAGGVPRNDVVGKDILEAYPSLDPSVSRLLYEVWSSGNPVIQSEVHYPIGEQDYWYDMHAVRLPDMTVAVAWRDVTASVNARQEAAQLQRQLEVSSRMEALGRLAGGVAHDFNNLLSVIIGHAEAAQLLGNDPEKANRHLEGIISTAARSTELTRQLLALARRQTGTPRILVLQRHVEELMSVLERLIGENVQVSLQMPPEDIAVLLDPSHLDQILTNLCTNAKEAIPQEGHVEIIVDTLSGDQLPAEWEDANADHHFARIRVRDDGIGMSDETLSHIFEPFFSLKEAGTGLGLATVYGIVKQNSGHMIADSREGAGTTIAIFLPIVPVDEPDVAGS